MLSILLLSIGVNPRLDLSEGLFLEQVNQFNQFIASLLASWGSHHLQGRYVGPASEDWPEDYEKGEGLPWESCKRTDIAGNEEMKLRGDRLPADKHITP